MMLAIRNRKEDWSKQGPRPEKPLWRIALLEGRPPGLPEPDECQRRPGQQVARQGDGVVPERFANEAAVQPANVVLLPEVDHLRIAKQDIRRPGQGDSDK